MSSALHLRDTRCLLPCAYPLRGSTLASAPLSVRLSSIPVFLTGRLVEFLINIHSRDKVFDKNVRLKRSHGPNIDFFCIADKLPAGLF